MEKNDWKPDLYLKFGQERIQPTIDLVSRIKLKNPQNIIDIGCGPGNSTQILYQKWPNANITGIDNSSAMIKKAKTNLPSLNWKLMDAGKDKIEGKFDLVFSNATIQWIPDHIMLLKKFQKMLAGNGVLATQIPLFWNMPLGKSIAKIAENKKWADRTKHVSGQFTIHDYHFYYEQLSLLFNKIEIWETHYMHTMESYKAILEMISSTGLRPYLQQLENDEEKNEFEYLVLEDIKKEYQAYKNGKVIFPFFRLFFIAYN